MLVVIPYEDERDAVRIANDSAYGLAGSVWTRDTEHGLEIARRIRTGSIGINQAVTADRLATRRAGDQVWIATHQQVADHVLEQHPTTQQEEVFDE